jgi:HEAT repeat protein
MKILSTNKNKDIRYWIIRIIGDINDPRGIKAILKVLTSKSPEFRAYAASALKNVTNPKIIQCLIKCLEDDSWNVAESAANSLQNIGPPAINQLVEKLKDCSDNVAYWIVKILCNVNLDILVKFIKFDNKNIHLLITEALADSNNPRSTKLLLEFMSNKYWDVRENAVESLIKQGEKVIIPMLFYLKNKEADVYFWAEKVFDGIAILHMTPLIKMLQSPDREIRISVAKIIGKTKSPLVVQPLINALSDDCWFVAKSAANALSNMGDQCFDNLLNIFKNLDTPENVKYWISIILARIEDNGKDVLIENLRDPDKTIRKLSAQALGLVRPIEALDPLIQTLNDNSWPVRNAAAQSIIQYGASITESISKYLMDRNDNVKVWSRRIIKEIGSEYVDTFIERVKGGKSTEIRTCAAVALGVLKVKKAADILCDIMFNDNDIWVRKYAASALADLKMPENLEKLISLLSDPNPEIRVWISEILSSSENFSINEIKKYHSMSEKTEEKILLSIALAEMGVKEMYSEVIKLMKASDLIRSQRAVRAAVKCNIEIIDSMVEFLDDINPELQKNIPKALRGIGKKCLPILKNYLKKCSQKKAQIIEKIIYDIEK